MNEEQAYSIKLEVFEGPFDLLCHLIEKNNIDIYDIPISLIADQYMDYLFKMGEFNLDIASEFLVMASTLLHIKSKLMLPQQRKDSDEQDEDPREELVLSVIEYKKYKDFSVELRSKGEYWNQAVYKFPEILTEPADRNYEYSYDINGEDLFVIYRKLQEINSQKYDNLETRINKIIENERFSLISKLKEIAGFLKVRASFIFNRIFNPEERSKSDIVTAFFALLELTRQEYLSLKQENLFGDLTVFRRRHSANIDFKNILD